MYLGTALNDFLQGPWFAKNQGPVETAALLGCMDFTLLDAQASTEALLALQKEAGFHNMAAICVLSQHLPLCNTLPSVVKKASVVNFPEGKDSLPVCFEAIEVAKRLGAEEIDYLAPYRIYLDQDKQTALHAIKQVIQHCKALQLTVKVIIETGMFTSLETLYDFSYALIDCGCDFLKTSTGKIPQGASLSAAFTLLSAIKASASGCGIKISGGVKTLDQALQYAYLAQAMLNKPIHKNWFRVGASKKLL